MHILAKVGLPAYAEGFLLVSTCRFKICFPPMPAHLGTEELGAGHLVV